MRVFFRLDSDSDRGGASSCHGQGPIRCKTLSCALPDLKNPWAGSPLFRGDSRISEEPTDHSLVYINIETISEGFLISVMCRLSDICWAVAYVF